MINVKVGNVKPIKPKKKKPKKVKPSAIKRALIESSKESAKRGARSSALIKKALKKRTRSVLGIGASKRREYRGLQGAITNKGKSAIRGGSAALAAFIAARYSPKAIAKYQDYAGRLRRSKRLIKQIVKIDDATYRIKRYIIKTDTAGNNPYSCTCPDFSQFSSDARNWLGSKAGPFNPCKHMMAVRDRSKGGKWVCSGGVCTLDPNAVSGYATQALCQASITPPLFNGGQCSVLYIIGFDWLLRRKTDNVIVGGGSKYYLNSQGTAIRGPLSSPTIRPSATFPASQEIVFFVNGVETRIGGSDNTTYVSNLICILPPSRVDRGLDNCGNPAGSCSI